MTYDPNDPRRVDVNDPRRARSGSMSGGMMAGIAIALLLFLGVMVWAFNSGNRDVAADKSPPATTGQRTTPSTSPAPTPAPPKAQ
jgi:hypothetical protein